MREVLALAGKDLKLLLRDKAGFFFTFFFPLIMAVFFGSMFSGGNEDNSMSILAIDEDQTDASAAFIRTLDQSDELNVELTTREDAQDRVRRGRRVAYIVLLKGFGAAKERVFWGTPPTVELGVDPARRAEAGLLEGVLMKYAAEGMQEVFQNPTALQKQAKSALEMLQLPGSMSSPMRENLIRFLEEVDRFAENSPTPDSGNGNFQGIQPLEVKRAEIVRQRSGPNNAYAVSFPQGIVWGMIGCAAAFGIGIVVERTRGTLVRLRIAPISQLQILAGKALACFITTAGVSTVLLLIAVFVFDVAPTSAPNLVLAVICVSLCFVGIMMLLSVLGKTEQSAGGIGWAVLLVMAMSGGGMLPVFLMPKWMQTISNVSPVKWAMLALEGPIWRDFSFGEMLLPCGILIGTGLLFFIIGTRAFRWMQAE